MPKKYDEVLKHAKPLEWLCRVERSSSGFPPIRSPNFPPSLKLCVLCVSVVKKSLCPTFADLPSSSDRRRHWDMCGRYRRTSQEEELARMYHIPIPKQTDLPISFNVAPSQDVLAVRYDPEKAVRSLVSLRWGLIPSWAKDEKIGYRTINARMETVQTAPAYRKAFKKRRCLILANGFMNGERRRIFPKAKRQ